MSEGGGGWHELGFLWEKQSWGLLNSDDNSISGGSSQEKKTVLMGTDHQAADQAKHTDASNKKRSSSSSEGKMKGKGISGGGGGDHHEVKERSKLDGESDHEIHIWTERERRKKMRNMFSNLQALLPQLPPKADKSTIVDEAVNYIKTLQQTLQKLQKLQAGTMTFGYEPSLIDAAQKLPFNSREAFLADQGSSSNSSNINTATNSSNSLLASRCTPSVFQTWTSSNVILNICGDEAQISVCSQKKLGLFATICYVLEKYKIEVISAHVSSECNRSMYMIQARANVASDQFTEAFPVEEIYKQAAGEIMFWVSS